MSNPNYRVEIPTNTTELIDLAAKDEYRSYIYGKYKHEFKAIRLITWKMSQKNF